jgi:nucleotidyltransferase substrate binding protein (TIGR01987 family)
MELREKLEQKKSVFLAAINDFEATLEIDTTNMEARVVDAIENGQIQKFEIVTELLWKTVKQYLLTQHAVDTQSPKQAIKAFFLVQALTDEEYNLWLDMLDDRNRLSHLYQKSLFEEIKRKLPSYLEAAQKAYSLL